MNADLFQGLEALPEEDKGAFVEHCMDKSNWAAERASKKAKDTVNNAKFKSKIGHNLTPEEREEREEQQIAEQSKNRAMVTMDGPKRTHFEMPRPGGAVSNTALKGKTVVLTGTFPEVGGGMGLTLGKDRVKSMVESFGGKVTSAISGRTDILIVGKEPGASTVVDSVHTYICPSDDHTHSHTYTHTRTNTYTYNLHLHSLTGNEGSRHE